MGLCARFTENVAVRLRILLAFLLENLRMLYLEGWNEKGVDKKRTHHISKTRQSEAVLERINFG